MTTPLALLLSIAYHPLPPALHRLIIEASAGSSKHIDDFFAGLGMDMSPTTVESRVRYDIKLGASSISGIVDLDSEKELPAPLAAKPAIAPTSAWACASVSALPLLNRNSSTWY